MTTSTPVLNVVRPQKVCKNLSFIQEAESWATDTAIEKDEAASLFIEGRGELSMKSRVTSGSYKYEFDGKNN